MWSSISVWPCRDYRNNQFQENKPKRDETGEKHVSWKLNFSIKKQFSFQLINITKLFPDVNECLSIENNICEQLCNNIPGSFYCGCRDGYNINADGYSCEGE